MDYSMSLREAYIMAEISFDNNDAAGLVDALMMIDAASYMINEL